MTPDRLQAEATILVAILRGDLGLDGLKASDFQTPIHGEIFRMLLDTQAAGGRVSPETVHEFLTARNMREIAAMLDRAGKDVEAALKEVKTGKRRLQLRTLEDIFRYPEPTYLINLILIEGTVSLVGAYTGTGKSIIILSIIKSILTGEPLWSRFPVLRTGPVLLIDEETPQGFLRERVERMGFHKDLPFHFLHFQGVRLDEEVCFHTLMERIEEVKPLLVVVDSLIRVHGQKEDDARDMSLVGARLRKIANWGTTVLVIHHHKKGEGPLNQKLRGSSDIPGGVDIEYALVRKDEYLEFSSVKTRTQPLESIRLKMEFSKAGIQVVYAGTEAEQILGEVRSFLEGTQAGVADIHKDLRERRIEIGEDKLRGILKAAAGKELIERSGPKGKKLYSPNPASQLPPLIYSQETGKQEIQLPGSSIPSSHAQEAQPLDNQGSEVSFPASQEGSQGAEKRIKIFEVID